MCLELGFYIIRLSRFGTGPLKAEPETVAVWVVDVRANPGTQPPTEEAQQVSEHLGRLEPTSGRLGHRGTCLRGILPEG